MLPEVFERLEAGDSGETQSEEGASWAGAFEASYADVDWSKSTREIHNQVRAWRHMFSVGGVVGPIAELDGERVKLLRTSLTDPGDGARCMECGDGRLWIVESEPFAT
jgi:methionyl-tRNA formyltransferase